MEKKREGKSRKEELRGLAIFRNMSWGKKKGKKIRDRFYFYIKDASIVKDPRFPFRDGDNAIVKVQGNKVILQKAKIVVQEVEE